MVKREDPWTGEVRNHKGQRLDEHGRELPDPRVIDPPIGHVSQPPLHELIRQMVRSEQIRQELEAAGAGSFEEEDDFDVDDDSYDPTSPYEENFDHLDGVQGAAPPAVAPAPAPAGDAAEQPSETQKTVVSPA